MTARVLILACSQRKKPAAGLLRAIDRYDGPAFRVLRKFQRENPDDNTQVYVLSAKFGLISGSKKIPDYDQRLTKDHAKRLREGVRRAARRFASRRTWSLVGICAGKDYRLLLDSVFEELGEIPIHFIRGGQGPRLTALRRWLLDSTS